MFPKLNSKVKKGLLRFFVLSARQIIPRLWCSTTAPSKVLWMEPMNILMRYEEMRTEDENKYPGFCAIWQPWVQIQTSQRFRDWIISGTHDLQQSQYLD
ncbi:hypothetical protein GDO78_012829 [Eleutherodactylus coqui]|uniref:Uncharacterized protein n=1 Tax=Eleutherodactylus coqui TaxID=57060 RepID=A0A8J6F225_ELECQ|nr:hypothetical protein GDO78_012829 [Eleutherodactylus coqui]